MPALDFGAADLDAATRKLPKVLPVPPPYF